MQSRETHILSCDNLSLRLGVKDVLKNVSFNLTSDLIILGDNGAGKSSLAKALCEPPHNAQIRIEGTLVAKLKRNTKAKLINYVPAGVDVFDGQISAMDFILSGLYPYQKRFEPFCDKQIRKALEILGLFNLQDLKDSPLISLSGGEKQISAIAQAAMQNAKITILDEPTANVDISRSKKIFHLLKSKKYFNNVVLITHDLSLAHAIGWDVLYLSDATTKFLGRSKDFFSDVVIKDIFGENVKVGQNGVYIQYAY